MSRKRAAAHDYICQRCLSAVDGPGPDAKHVSGGGGGRGSKACSKAPIPVLRAEHDAAMQRDAAAAVAAIRGLRLTSPSVSKETDR